MQYIVRVADQIDQVLTARAADAGQPVFDCSLPRTSPLPDDFDGLMGGAQFAFQSIGDGPGVRTKILAVWKNYLVLTNGYLGKLLGNARVVRYLAQHHRDILTEFQKLA